MNEEQYFKEIRNFENKYYEIISYFDTNFPKPINLQQEKKIFLKAIADDKFYNPQIKYEKKNLTQKNLIN